MSTAVQHLCTSNASLNYLATPREWQISTAVEHLCTFKRIFELPWQTLERGKCQRLLSTFARSNAPLNHPTKAQKRQMSAGAEHLCIFKRIFERPQPTLERGQCQRLLSTFASSNASLNHPANPRERQMSTAVEHQCIFKRIFELPGHPSRMANFNGC